MMSSEEFASQAPPAVRPVDRPTSLTVGYFAALLASLSSLGGAVALMVSAKELANKVATDVVGTDAAGVLGSSYVTEALEAAAHTLVVRGMVGLVAAMLLLGFALLARNGALWARITLIVMLLVALATNALAVRDVVPPISKVLDLVAILSCLVAASLVVLPASGRYAKTRKQAKA
jgi:hypothetical protein